MKKAFTLMETLVVVGVLSFALPTLYTILFIILQQQVKMLKLKQVKKEGAYITQDITSVIRNNATGIYSAQSEASKICSFDSGTKSYTNTLYFKDRNGNWFSFDNADSQNIASQSSISNAGGNLNSSRVLVSGFTSSCFVNDYSTPIAIIGYDICFNTSQTSPSCGTTDVVSFHFQSTVKLRNY